MGLMRKNFVHASRVEVPHWLPTHNIHARQSHESKVRELGTSVP